MNLVIACYCNFLDQKLLVEFRQKGISCQGYPIYSKSSSLLPLCSMILVPTGDYDHINQSCEPEVSATIGQAIEISNGGSVTYTNLNKSSIGWLKKNAAKSNLYILLNLIGIGFINGFNTILCFSRESVFY
jgi:hypothetical protein